MTAPISVTGAVLGPLLQRDTHRPRLTWYTADGDRTELSTASLANWSAKVAGLLTDELGATPGDRVAVLLGPGWQTLPILLGTWWAGCVVTDQDDPEAVAAFVPDGADPALGAADEVFVVSGHPLGAPSRAVAPHQRDFTAAVLPQADRFGGARVGPTAPALAGSAELTVAGVLDLARAAGLPAEHRALVTGDWTLPDPALAALLGPLSADGSVVAVSPAADPAAVARWAEAEKAS